MFESEEVPICFNTLYTVGVQNDIFALICEANKTATFAIKTPNGLTEKTTIRNKVMQGDALNPLLSSNIVDKHVGRMSSEISNIYVYKNTGEIPPLAIQENTLSISDSGKQLP